MARLAWGRVLGAAGLIGGVPCLVLVVLLLEGAVEPYHGLLALLACGLAALAVARLWIGNLAALAEALRRAADEDGRLIPPHGLLLPAVGEIAEGVGRLARSLAEQGA
ncbi:MAG: two-component sensor histidine kinase, partial [Belnapia sp.]|nr:two-component sensor histidine kinase [Belnapia sp.]